MIRVAWGDGALSRQEADRALACVSENVRDAVARIVNEEAARAGISVALLMGRSRTRPYAHARMRAMGRAYEETMMSLPEVGRYFDNRAHTSVLHAVRWYREQVKA